jgi:hypothetical protein
MHSNFFAGEKLLLLGHYIHLQWERILFIAHYRNLLIITPLLAMSKVNSVFFFFWLWLAVERLGVR